MLSAHPGGSQGRPRTTPGSQPISQHGLPILLLQRAPIPDARYYEPSRPVAPHHAVSRPDNGNEFRASFDRLLTQRAVRHIRTRPGRPQTLGHVERLHKTILDECWRPSFARYLHITLGGLRRDLTEYLDYYNTDRAHNGRITKGRIPADIIDPAHKIRPRA